MHTIPTILAQSTPQADPQIPNGVYGLTVLVVVFVVFALGARFISNPRVHRMCFFMLPLCVVCTLATAMFGELPSSMSGLFRLASVLIAALMVAVSVLIARRTTPALPHSHDETDTDPESH